MIASDIVLDFADELDENDPFRALALKTIRNLYNGSYAVKADAIGLLAQEMDADAVIHFCHWGCKQGVWRQHSAEGKDEGTGNPHADPGRGRH